MKRQKLIYALLYILKSKIDATSNNKREESHFIQDDFFMFHWETG